MRGHWYDMETGDRTEVQAGDGEPVYTLRENYIDEVTARQAARSKLDMLQRGTATLSLTLRQGNPVIGAETPLTLTGFREGVNGRWIATRVTHGDQRQRLLYPGRGRDADRRVNHPVLEGRTNTPKNT